MSEMYRVAWKAPTGATGHGNWTSSIDVAEAAMKLAATEHPDVQHWIEKK